ASGAAIPAARPVFPPRRGPAPGGPPAPAPPPRFWRARPRGARPLPGGPARHEKDILAIVRSWRPDLLTQPGVGPIIAATVLCAWSHPGRIRSEAAFAMLAGAAPIPASSGQTTTRHRLNRYGDRQLNRALHTAVLSRLRYHPATQPYAQRR